LTEPIATESRVSSLLAENRDRRSILRNGAALAAAAPFVRFGSALAQDGTPVPGGPSGG
jgi:hypothetical protein